MIDLLLIFKESGISLLGYNLTENRNLNEKNEEELVTGFFSVLFQYFSTQFGQIQSIRTEKKMILIKKIESVYVSLVITLLENPTDSRFEKVWFLNNRIEEMAIRLIKSIERILVPYLKKIEKKKESSTIEIPLDQQIQKNLILITKNSRNKMTNLKDMIGPNSKKTNELKRIYQNV
ncbi:MAG: hypothetical protein GF364_09100 [Candidatus Lokiarchaeota archaeon]|nr:hypothetical protein [Candidatus Lokiarchaeota archaeon]